MGVAIVEALRESSGEVAGLLLTILVVAVLAWLGHRQETRRAEARREARAARRRTEDVALTELIPPAWDPADLPPQADPWPHADDHDLARLTLLDVRPAGVR